jgi:hypothetical protein
LHVSNEARSPDDLHGFWLPQDTVRASSLKQVQEWIVDVFPDPLSRQTLTLDAVEVLNCLYRGMRSEIFFVEQKSSRRRFALKSMIEQTPAVALQAVVAMNGLMKANFPFLLHWIRTIQ